MGVDIDHGYSDLETGWRRHTVVSVRSGSRSLEGGALAGERRAERTANPRWEFIWSSGTKLFTLFRLSRQPQNMAAGMLGAPWVLRAVPWLILVEVQSRAGVGVPADKISVETLNTC